MTEQQELRAKKRAIYLLPNLFTTMGLLAGFYAVIAAMENRFEYAAIAIFLALLLDGTDGHIARLTNTVSDFGKEYDSLADMVSFGVAPALVFYRWSRDIDIGLDMDFLRLVWPAAFLYTVAAALRLARFNAKASRTNKKYFEGLPSPAAAGMVAAYVWLITELEIVNVFSMMLGVAVTISCAYLMVSRWPYRSFKDINLGDKVPFARLVIVAVVLVVIALNPPFVLCGMFSVYVLSSPSLYLFKRLQKTR